jgi:hypothetical protein
MGAILIIVGAILIIVGAILKWGQFCSGAFWLAFLQINKFILGLVNDHAE